MAEALSQSQIDELLKSAQSGGSSNVSSTVPQLKIKEYDFSSPKKFTKDQLKSLANIYENFGRILTSYLSSVLRNSCTMKILDVEEQRYVEFSNSLPDSTLVGAISFEALGNGGLSDILLMQFPTSLGYLLAERMLGATDKPYVPDRSFTEIEMTIITMIFNNITKYMQDAWSNFFDIKTSLRSIETNGRLIQAYSQQDIIVITSIEFTEGDYTGLLHICIPADNLERIIDSFSVKKPRSMVSHAQEEEEQQKKKLLFGYLKESDLEMEAILDNFEIPLQDIVYLQPGDVISLNKKIDHDINVVVEGVPWGTAKIGESNHKKAIKIVEVLESKRKGGMNFVK